MTIGEKKFIPLGLSPMINCPCFSIWPHIPVCAVILTGLSRLKKQEENMKEGEKLGMNMIKIHNIHV